MEHKEYFFADIDADQLGEYVEEFAAGIGGEIVDKSATSLTIQLPISAFSFGDVVKVVSEQGNDEIMISSSTTPLMALLGGNKKNIAGLVSFLEEKIGKGMAQKDSSGDTSSQGSDKDIHEFSIKSVEKRVTIASILGVAFTVLIVFAYIAGKSKNEDDLSDIDIDVDDVMRYEIWDAFIDTAGVDAKNYYQVSGEIEKGGTVPARSMGSSVGGELPAWLACYDYVRDACMDGIGCQEVDSGMCVYYVENVERDKYYILWKGKEYKSQLVQKMKNDGFVGN